MGAVREVRWAASMKLDRADFPAKAALWPTLIVFSSFAWPVSTNEIDSAVVRL